MKVLRHLILLALVVQGLAAAEEKSFALDRIGFRVEFDAESTIDLTAYEVVASWSTPWTFSLGESPFSGAVFIETGGGVIDGESETEGLLLARPGLRFGREGSPLALVLASGPAVLTGHRFGDLDLGCDFQFASCIGFDCALGTDWVVGYRFQHLSNAGFDDRNPGIETHAVELTRAF